MKNKWYKSYDQFNNPQIIDLSRVYKVIYIYGKKPSGTWLLEKLGVVFYHGMYKIYGDFGSICIDREEFKIIKNKFNLPDPIGVDK